MNGTYGRWFVILASCLMGLGAAGCANLDGPSGGAPFEGHAADDLPDVPSPAERIASLRKLAREAPRTDAEEKQRIALELAESIRTEEDPLIRTEIIRTLGEYPCGASNSVLRAALDDPDLEARVAACEAWGHRGDAEAASRLAGVLDGDLDTDVRLAAARALGRSKDPAAVAALGRALEDNDPALQYRAVLSLRKVTGEDFGNDVSRWQQYVAGQVPRPAEAPSLAERLRGMLMF
jgi:HEAT repeat protein